MNSWLLAAVGGGVCLGGSQVEKAKCYDGRTEIKCDTMLNSLGAQGWDLTSAYPESSTGGDKGWAGVTTTEVFIFKRAKSTDAHNRSRCDVPGQKRKSIRCVSSS
jgi:hypothetical protein